MKLKATIPKKSASLLILRPNHPSKISFFNYTLLVLQRKEKLSFGSGLVFPGGKLQQSADEQYRRKYGLKDLLQSSALRECFQQTGLHFSSKPLLQSEDIDKLSKIRLQYIANFFNGVPGTRQKAFQRISQLLPPALNLLPFIRLITVPQIKSRYDTTFYALPIQDYKYVNFLRYAQHQKYLHELDNIVHSDHEFVNFRWMNPAQILHEHFNKVSIIHPPQFIMLNIMLKFNKYQQFLEFIKNTNQPISDKHTRNMSMGPNIVSLILNHHQQHQKYPYAATLLGDSEFPFTKIIHNQQCEELKKEMSDWKEWQHEHIDSLGRNRFLFSEGKKFFQTEYDVICNTNDSVVRHLKPWSQTHELLDSVSFDKKQ